MKIRQAVWMLLLTFPSLAGWSQKRPVSFEHLTSADGLSQSNVSCILQDSRGFMWFGTQDGLNKYDGYSMHVYRKDPSIAHSISCDYITDILEDAQGDLWVATWGGGLNHFDRRTELFTSYRNDRSDTNSLSNNFISALCRDHEGNIWISTDNGLLNVLEASTKKFRHYRHNAADPGSISDDLTTKILEDNKQRIWVGTTSGGLNLFNPRSNSFTHYTASEKNKNALSNNNISALFEDSRHNLWVGTTGGGINRKAPGENTFHSYQQEKNNPNSLADNVVFSIAEDVSGNIWIGSENGGLSVLNPATQTFQQYYQNSLATDGLSSSSINCLYRDRKGDIWIGTYNAGINMVSTDINDFVHYKHTISPNSLSHNNVAALFEDSRQRLWVGTDGGGLDMLDRKTGVFTHYTHQDGNPNSIGGNFVLSVAEDVQHNIWVGTYGNGLTVFNPDKNTYRQYKYTSGDPGNPVNNDVWCIFRDKENTMWIGKTRNGISRYDPLHDKFIPEQNNLGNNRVLSMAEDSLGCLWVGTDGGGLSCLNKQTGKVKQYLQNDSANSISDNSVNCLYVDPSGKLWIGTNEGFNSFDIRTQRFKNYFIQDGLPNSNISGILPDAHTQLWISSNKGLSCFNPAAGTFKNFDVSDGLQSNEFRMAYCSSRRGALYFGGINGFNEFYPDRMKGHPYDPPLVLTDFQISNRRVNIAATDSDQSPLKQSITETSSLMLPYNNSVISFQFASLNYTSSRKKKYAYMLEGFDNNWNEVGSRRTAYYTNLDPGTYTFRVKGTDNEGKWSARTAGFTLTITPPFWMTWWFRILTGISVIAICMGYYQYRMQNIRRQKKVLQNEVDIRTAQLAESTAEERKARQEAEQANKAKSIFLATMSHEIRTPMNGVIGMASLLRKTALTPEQKLYADTITVSGDALLTVINDILDFSKIESGNLELEQKDFNLGTCIEEVLDVFADKANQSGLELIYQIDPEIPDNINGDCVRLRQVLINLVSNAIKFTNQGEIYIEVQLLQKRKGNHLELLFKVRDTGIGIPSDKIDRLFKAFSQVDSSTTRKYGGTGLGLVICEKLVSLMGGTMKVDSTPGSGSIFSFNLQTIAGARSAPAPINMNLSGIRGKRVLVVDDNFTNRLILQKQLEHWHLVPVMASSAAEALDILSRDKPFDLVLSDMQMPETDGIALARKIRKLHPPIPIILLSSLGDVRNKEYPGLFNAVLTKPIKHQTLCTYILQELRSSGNKPVQAERTEEQSEKDFSKRYPLRILLAEDHAINQLLATKMLDTLGYTATIAENGLQVLERLKAAEYDLILMDVQMPELDGLETTKHIRRDLAIQPVIIAMTANALQSDVEECLHAGMDDYLSKPVKVETLKNMIEKWGRQNSVRSAV